LEKGVIHFSSVTFSVPGAGVELAGDYGVQGGELNFKGHVRLQAKLSQMVTGAKSDFLKLLDPFFSKHGAGTELPVTITGTRENPTFGVSIFHKTLGKIRLIENCGVFQKKASAAQWPLRRQAGRF